MIFTVPVTIKVMIEVEADDREHAIWQVDTNTPMTPIAELIDYEVDQDINKTILFGNDDQVKAMRMLQTTWPTSSPEWSEIQTYLDKRIDFLLTGR